LPALDLRPLHSQERPPGALAAPFWRGPWGLGGGGSWTLGGWVRPNTPRMFKQRLVRPAGSPFAASPGTAAEGPGGAVLEGMDRVDWSEDPDAARGPSVGESRSKADGVLALRCSPRGILVERGPPPRGKVESSIWCKVGGLKIPGCFFVSCPLFSFPNGGI